MDMDSSAFIKYTTTQLHNYTTTHQGMIAQSFYRGYLYRVCYFKGSASITRAGRISRLVSYTGQG